MFGVPRKSEFRYDIKDIKLTTLANRLNDELSDKSFLAEFQDKEQEFTQVLQKAMEFISFMGKHAQGMAASKGQGHTAERTTYISAPDGKQMTK